MWAQYVVLAILHHTLTSCKYLYTATNPKWRVQMNIKKFLGKFSKNTYMLFTGWEVRTGKIFCRGLKNGPRPKAEGRF